jgi:Skp family chaperone for outer membrane proteins
MGFRVWLGREVAMQIIVRWISIIFAVLTAIPAVAGSIGFLDTERALKTVKEGQRQYQILDAWANQRADEVEAKQNRVTELTQQLNAQRTAASADVIRKLEEDLLQAQRDLEDAGRALQTDFQSKQSELLDAAPWPLTMQRQILLMQFSFLKTSRWSTSPIRPSSRMP